MIWCLDRENPEESILRKEVIQPLVRLRPRPRALGAAVTLIMGCYDLVPIDRFIFGACQRRACANKNPADLSSGGVIFSIRQHLRRWDEPPARFKRECQHDLVSGS
jgi:hypothetical protein